MKAKVFVFYAVSALSLSLFIISPAAEDQSFSGTFPQFAFSQALIESADRLVAAKY